MNSSASGVVSDADEVPLEVLEQRLTAGAASIAAHEAQWLGWVAEYDERGGFESWGCISTAQWLGWRCGLAPTAARERVRVARALRGLPLIDARFRAGELTWTKVRALTRVADGNNEVDLVAIAVEATGAQLERICRALRKVGGFENEDPAVAFASRSWSKRRNYDGTTTFMLRVVDDAVAGVCAQVDGVVDAMLGEAVGDSSRPRRDVIDERNGLAAMRSDAAVALLTGVAHAEPAPADVTLVVDADHEPVDPQPIGRVATDVPAGTSAVQFSQYGNYLSESVGRRLCCDPRVTALMESARTGEIGVGRAHRFVTRKLRRALERRDHHSCQFPGCAATTRLHAHHIVHWVDGGETELDNLILLCHFHHHLVHDGGWSIDRTDQNFSSPVHGRVDPAPALAMATIDRLVNEIAWDEPEPPPIRAPHLDRLDLHWAIAVIADNAEIRSNEATNSVPAGTPIGK